VLLQGLSVLLGLYPPLFQRHSYPLNLFGFTCSGFGWTSVDRRHTRIRKVTDTNINQHSVDVAWVSSLRIVKLYVSVKIKVSKEDWGENIHELVFEKLLLKISYSYVLCITDSYNFAL